jgi:hypothetical protein
MACTASFRPVKKKKVVKNVAILVILLAFFANLGLSAITITTDKPAYYCFQGKCEPVTITINNDAALATNYKVSIVWDAKAGSITSAKLPYLTTAKDNTITTSAMTISSGKSVFKFNASAHGSVKFNISVLDGTNKVIATLDPYFYDLFNHRMNISINNTANSVILTNYAVLLNITYNSNMSADFSDLLFSMADGSLNLSHWIQNKVNSNYADVWVNVTSIPANDYAYISMFWANQSAFTSLNNGYKVFPVFTDGSIDDSAEWLCAGVGSCTVVRYNDGGNYVMNYTGTAPHDNNGMYKDYVLSTNFSISAKWLNHISGGQQQFFFVYPIGAIIGSYAGEVIAGRRAGNNDLFSYNSNTSGAFTPAGAGAFNLDEWHTEEIKYLNTTLISYYDGVQKYSGTQNRVNLVYAVFGAYQVGAGEYWFDDVIVRKITDPEPSIIYAGIETAPPAPPDYLNITYLSPDILNYNDTHDVNFSITPEAKNAFINCSLNINNVVYLNTTAVANNTAVLWSQTLANGVYVFNMSCATTTLTNITGTYTLVVFVPAILPNASYNLCIGNISYRQHIYSTNGSWSNDTELEYCDYGCEGGLCNDSPFLAMKNGFYIFILILVAIALILYIGKRV